MNTASPTTAVPTDAASEGRRSRRRRELHQTILDTAADLFARDGYDATTVEKISIEADIAPATFFNHFPSKEDVLREVGQDVFTRFRRLVEEQLKREGSSVQRLDGFATRSADLVRRAPEMTRRVLIAVLRSSRPGESGNELASMQEDFARLLRQGGDVPAQVDLDLTAEIIVSVVIGCMTHWINDPSYPLGKRMRESLSLLGERLLIPAKTAVSPARRAVAAAKPSTAKPTTNPTSRAAKAGAKPQPKRKPR